jgi:di/tricarboxylate transporter
VLSRCLTVEEAYRSVEWPAIVLIAGMIPLGLAMDHTGASRLVAEGIIGTLGQFGPHGVLAGIALMTTIGAQVIPTVALAVLMAPIALTTAANLGMSPQALMMAVALSAGSLSSPVSQPANAIVMGPGGYRYSDYVRVGLPLTIILLVVIVFLLPVFFPLVP